jgi:hypothetical protein
MAYGSRGLSHFLRAYANLRLGTKFATLPRYAFEARDCIERDKPKELTQTAQIELKLTD